MSAAVVTSGLTALARSYEHGERSARRRRLLRGSVVDGRPWHRPGRGQQYVPYRTLVVRQYPLWSGATWAACWCAPVDRGSPGSRPGDTPPRVRASLPGSQDLVPGRPRESHACIRTRCQRANRPGTSRTRARSAAGEPTPPGADDDHATDATRPDSVGINAPVIVHCSSDGTCHGPRRHVLRPRGCRGRRTGPGDWRPLRASASARAVGVRGQGGGDGGR